MSMQCSAPAGVLHSKQNGYQQRWQYYSADHYYTIYWKSGKSGVNIVAVFCLDPSTVIASNCNVFYRKIFFYINLEKWKQMSQWHHAWLLPRVDRRFRPIQKTGSAPAGAKSRFTEHPINTGAIHGSTLHATAPWPQPMDHKWPTVSKPLTYFT